MRHSISNIKRDSREGECSICGPVDLKWTGSTFRCGNKHREMQRPYDKKRAARRIAESYFNISMDEYQNARLEFLSKQNGKCAICEKKIDIDSGRLDHNHDTGELRGLLCSNCNCGLGLLGDNLESVQKAIRYLSQW